MPKYDFDLFTIGAGSGGVAGSRRAAGYGARVGICEDVRIGGTCVLRGCVPKKLLVYAAHFADDFQDAAGFGWTVPEPSFSWAKLIANKNRELDRLNAIYVKLLDDSGVERFEGRGRFIDPHTVEISGPEGARQVTAERIMIATGSHPVAPAIPGIEHVISSDQALDLPSLPKRMVIVGGGYIAVEFAGIFGLLGVEVTLVIRAEELLRGFDNDLRVGLRQEYAERGIKVLSRTHITGIEKSDAGYVLSLEEGGTLETDLVMYATGRQPNIRGMGLEEIGIKLGLNHAVPVDEWSETIVPGVYAVGDVTDRLNLTPVAIGEARALAETLYNDNPIKFDPTLVATAVFSTPPIAVVGLSEDDARRAGHEIDVYRSRFRPMKNTLSGRNEFSLMKLVVDRQTDRVLGAHMLGVDAGEIIQGVAIALKCGATKQQFDQTVGIHPTAAEEFVTMRTKVA